MAIIDKFQKAAGGLRKCPSCGQQVSGLDAVCPLCGYELEIAKPGKSIDELAKQIEKLERKRNSVTDSMAARFSKSGITPTDEKIISLIRNYVIPNTKADILEFMIFAAGNIDAKVLSGEIKNGYLSQEVVKAWENKFRQAYQKASISFGNEPDFHKIQGVYEAKIKEIEKEGGKLFSIFQRRR